MASQAIVYENSPDNVLTHRLYARLPELQRRYGLWIISGSTNNAPPHDFARCRVRKFEFYSISHFFAGNGRFWQAGEGERELEIGEAVIIAPGDCHRYGSSGDLPYSEDSLRFTGPVADLLRENHIIKTGVYQLGALRRLLPIIELVADPAPSSQLKANIMLQQLLTELFFKQRKAWHDPAVGEAIALIKSQPEKWWTVAELAEQCNLSENQFRRNFERYTGLAPKKYLEELKLRRAAELLSSSIAPIAEIGKLCGYTDPFHFSRRFKQFWGVPPEKFRRAAMLNSIP